MEYIQGNERIITGIAMVIGALLAAYGLLGDSK